jgi:hypothetical protein
MPVTFAGTNIWALGAGFGLLAHAFSNRVRKVNITHSACSRGAESRATNHHSRARAAARNATGAQTRPLAPCACRRAGPWEIPIAAMVGGYAFQWWDGVCERSEEKLAAIRAERFEANKEIVKPPAPSPLPKF